MLTAAASELRDRFPELEMRAAAVHDDPRRAVVDVAEHAALTVVGSRGRGRIPELLLGSVALYVAAHARSPVAVVPPTADVGAVPAAGPILLGRGRIRGLAMPPSDSPSPRPVCGTPRCWR